MSFYIVQLAFETPSSVMPTFLPHRVLTAVSKGRIVICLQIHPHILILLYEFSGVCHLDQTLFPDGSVQLWCSKMVMIK